MSVAVNQISSNRGDQASPPTLFQRGVMVFFEPPGSSRATVPESSWENGWSTNAMRLPSRDSFASLT